MPRTSSRVLLLFAASLITTTIASMSLAVDPPTTTPTSTPAPAAAAPTSMVDQLRPIAQRAFDNHEWVGLSIGIAQSDAPITTMHFGHADRENELPADDTTMYRWASISKPVTAVAAWQLVKQGTLDLDADVRTYVPEFPAKKWTVTSRQLMCHQGGIVHYRNGKVVPRIREHTDPHPFKDTVTALDAFLFSPLICEPGTAYNYTTHGFMLLGAVVQKAGNEPFADQIRTRIFEPLKMTSAQPDYQWIDIPNRAIGYRPGDDGQPVRSTNTDVSWKLPGGGLISTVGDLTRFGRGLCNDSLLSDDTRASMFTRQSLNNGEQTNYGLGIGVGTLNETQVVSHGGAQEKTATYLLVCPEKDLVVAVMCNTQGARLGGLARQLMSVMMEESTARSQ